MPREKENFKYLDTKGQLQIFINRNLCFVSMFSQRFFFDELFLKGIFSAVRTNSVLFLCFFCMSYNIFRHVDWEVLKTSYS
jgi:hypothetical protein